MDEDWTIPPFLGPVPDFHADPAVGGVPLASADGHWWWDGTHWSPLHAPVAEPSDAPRAETAQPAPRFAQAS